jgi:hypothetical protein
VRRQAPGKLNRRAVPRAVVRRSIRRIPIALTRRSGDLRAWRASAVRVRLAAHTDRHQAGGGRFR